MTALCDGIMNTFIQCKTYSSKFNLCEIMQLKFFAMGWEKQMSFHARNMINHSSCTVGQIDIRESCFHLLFYFIFIVCFVITYMKVN